MTDSDIAMAIVCLIVFVTFSVAFIRLADAWKARSHQRQLVYRRTGRYPRSHR